MFSQKQKAFFIMLIGLSIGVTIIETMSISLIMPFVTIAMGNGLVLDNHFLILNKFFSAFHVTTQKQQIIVLGGTIIGAYAVRALVTILFNYINHTFSFNQFRDISLRVFINCLQCNFRDFSKFNSADIWKIIVGDSFQLAMILLFVFKLATEVFVILFTYGLLLWINLRLTMVLTAFLVLMALLIWKFIMRSTASQGEMVGLSVNMAARIFNEAFGNYKVLKVFNREQFFINRLNDVQQKAARASTLNNVLQEMPRVLLETVAIFMFVGFVMYIVCRYHDASKAIPLLSLYALAFSRFLPAASRIFSYYNNIVYAKNTVNSYQSPLMQQHTEKENVHVVFNKSIRLCHVDYGHNEKILLSDVCCEIKKGDKVAIVGESGLGKSTLIDLILGFYAPRKGSICIDDVVLDNTMISSWRSHIGYVPQQIYLFDGTVAGNIVFDRKYDEDRLIEVLKQVSIYDILLEKEGINTQVGEGGVQLSGGQKQRIALARALYSNPEILVLDEATSALDSDTEEKIVENLWKYYAKKTIIIVTHRMSVVQKCSIVHVLQGGTLVRLDHKNKTIDDRQRVNYIYDNFTRN